MALFSRFKQWMLGNPQAPPTNEERAQRPPRQPDQRQALARFDREFYELRAELRAKLRRDWHE